jgi:sirohydrochlorin cobaltochelatase
MAIDPALVLFAHGARDPDWALPFHKIQAAIRNRRATLVVELAFLEFMQPPLRESVMKLASAGHRRIVVAPLFMARGGHLKHDIPQLLAGLRDAHPGVAIELLPAIGDSEAILGAIADWLLAAIEH